MVVNNRSVSFDPEPIEYEYVVWVAVGTRALPGIVVAQLTYSTITRLTVSLQNFIQ